MAIQMINDVNSADFKAAADAVASPSRESSPLYLGAKVTPTGVSYARTTTESGDVHYHAVLLCTIDGAPNQVVWINTLRQPAVMLRISDAWTRTDFAPNSESFRIRAGLTAFMNANPQATNAQLATECLRLWDNGTAPATGHTTREVTSATTGEVRFRGNLRLKTFVQF